MTIQTYTVSVKALLIDVDRTWQKLLQRSRIPAATAIIGLSPPLVSSFVRLHTQEFPPSSDEVARRLEGSSQTVRYDRRLTLGLTLQDELLGATYGYPLSSSDAYIYGIAIKRNWRRSWATVVLKQALFFSMHNAGFKHAHFQAMNNNKDTLNHARRVGAMTRLDIAEGDLSPSQGEPPRT
ncbi:MAG: hypothetical protein ACE360_03975 [Hyphomicrobiales bacterium]